MPVYQCPVCSRRGVYSIGNDDFYEWLADYFGQYYTAEPNDLLPLPCQVHYKAAGEPTTDQEFKEWLNGSRNRTSSSNGEAAKKKARVRSKKTTVPDDDGEKPSKGRLAALKAWATRRRNQQQGD